MNNKIKYWFLACRPKTLTGAAVPVSIASACACADGCFKWDMAVMCLLFAFGMQICSNLINDLFDYLKGSDREDRLGPQRACSQGWITPQAMKAGICVSVLVSCMFGLGILYLSLPQLLFKGWELIAVGCCCVVFAYLYTSILSYKGYGDSLVILFFGIVPVCTTYYVQTSVVTLPVFLLSLACGNAIDALLVVNNYRDREQDKISGKNTTVVLFGEKFGSFQYLMSGIIPVSIIFLVYIFDSLQVSMCGYISIYEAVVVMIVYLSVHIAAWKKMMGINKGRQLNQILGRTSLNILIFGILLTLIIINN
ncbi:MAG: 1,4-dihydroxy-2-naphthoate octaprenyltransferase [Bacteroidales bacterium]|nr:1,4-dihydroxy-2-naphthoate octaprenyltransferase [Bacteroidales bacterium]